MKPLLEKYWKKSLSFILFLAVLATAIPVWLVHNIPTSAAEIHDTGYQESAFGTLLEEATQFIVVKHKQLGGSHYAYTDGLSDEIGSPEDNESIFWPGSQMVLVTLYERNSNIWRSEEVLLDSPEGVVRDPDVSEDGTKVLFSWKKDSADDFHLYEMEIQVDATPKQLTFGSGVADVEPKYLGNGKIVFQSTRCTSYVDCWKIAVMNTYTCNADGTDIMRLGYDQVHTTYPTTTEDGRILYTRWDYNDRNQMYVQGVFQMFPDGTNQTEVYGNDSNFPTTLLHTREVPGSTGVYVSISSGHHNRQAGKLVLVDTNVGRNDADAVKFVFEDSTNSTKDSEDLQNQSGALYKYPIALNDHEFLVSHCKSGWNGGNEQENSTTKFDIYYMNSKTKVKILLSEYNSTYGCGASQVAMVKKKDLFERPSMVNQAVEYGTYYMGNVYAGGGLEGVEPDTAKYLRVVEIEYRPYAIGATNGYGTGSADPYSPVSTGNGAWDVKRVLGVVAIEEDGSALFRVPANTPIYFQVLNEDGEMIQSMRSWSTLMPNETFSCVGCHEDKNTVPPYQYTTTIAMKNGVQELQPDLWMTEEDGTEYEEGEYDVEEDTKGFSYTEMVQPILDAKCISCHNDETTSLNTINNVSSESGNGNIDSEGTIELFPMESEFVYSINSQSETEWTTQSLLSLAGSYGWKSGNAPFGDRAPSGTNMNTTNLYLRQDFTLSSEYYNNLNTYDVYLRIFYDQDPRIYLNGTEIFSASGWLDEYKDIQITEAFFLAAKSGLNQLAVDCKNDNGGMMMDFGIYLVPKAENILFDEGSIFQYYASTSQISGTKWTGAEYDDSRWTRGVAPFGVKEIEQHYVNTNWTTNYLYLRSSFTLSEDTLNKIRDGKYAVYMNIAWDENPTIYLNGTEILTKEVYVNDFVTTYKDFDITDAFLNAMQGGTNIVAASASNLGGGGQFLDFGIYLVPKTEIIPVFEQGSSFQYTTTEQKNKDWIAEKFNDTAWTEGSAPFHNNDNNTAGTYLRDASKLYLRSSFDFSEEQYAKLQNGTYDVYIDIFWDENPQLYLNGIPLFAPCSYSTTYETFNITTPFLNAVKVEHNTLAAYLVNEEGGQFLDFNIYMVPKSSSVTETAFSLEGIDVEGSREKIYYSLSYLVLTNSTLHGNEYLGNSTNSYTNWISSMSQCEMLDPYQYGSTKSELITMLKNGHGGVNLTEKEIQTIAAWIDLGVPFRGAYDESTNWGINEQREATEKQNKRDYYDALDETTKRILGGAVDTDKLPISISYNDSTRASVTNNGMAILYPEVGYRAGDTITVTLPEGVEYFFFALDARVGEALIYCPTGTYTYTIPNNMNNIFPFTYDFAEHPTISARIATVEELAETRNLAVNPYDVATNIADAAAYPHASASTQYNDLEYAARNAIDGVAINERQGTYPVQSWGAAKADPNMYYVVNFGTEVCVSSVDIAVRADWSDNHDTYFTSAVLEFSDDTTQNIILTKDSDMQSFAIEGGPKETSYVKITSMQTADDKWAGLSEVEVYGTVYAEGEVPLMDITMAETLNLDLGTKKTLAVTYLPNDTTVDKTISWSSTNPTVATVDSNGTVLPLTVGETIITAKVGDEIATCSVTVQKSTTGVTVYDYQTGEVLTVYYPKKGILSLEELKKDSKYLYVAWYDKPESAEGEIEISSASAGDSVYLQKIAIEAPIIVPDESKSIRYIEPNGLRFKAIIHRGDFYNYFNQKGEDYVYDRDGAEFSFGMLIIPSDLIPQGGELTHDTTYVKDVKGKKIYNQFNVDAEKKQGDLEYTGVIVNFPIEMYVREMTARAYVQYTFKGETYTLYSEEISVGSYLGVAKAVYKDPNLEDSIRKDLEDIFGDALQN